MTSPDLAPILGTENLLVLVEQPGDETRHCGEVIAALCRAGRPPFVVVLTDGPAQEAGQGAAQGAAADAQVRAGLVRLGLDGGRMLMFGIAGSLPGSGPVFEAAVHAVCFVSWRHDCNILLAPASAQSPVNRLAGRAAAESGVGVAWYGADPVRLVAAPRRSARAE